MTTTTASPAKDPAEFLAVLNDPEVIDIVADAIRDAEDMDATSHDFARAALAAVRKIFALELAHKPITADELDSYLSGARPGDQELSVMVPVHVVARAVADLRSVQVPDEWEYEVRALFGNRWSSWAPVTSSWSEKPWREGPYSVEQFEYRRRRKLGEWEPTP